VRTVPGVDPTEAQAKLIDYLLSHAPFGARVEVTAEDAGAGYQADMDSPVTKALHESLTEAWGVPSVNIGVGGSIPFISDFQRIFPSAQVVVTQKVDEVVLVGTGAAKKQESKPEQSQSQGQGQSQGQAQSQGQGQTQAPSESSGGSGGSASGGSAGTNDGPVGDDVWAKLAQCESGGNPATNTGNGFYGMYQFTLETWQSLGGTGYPHEADAATWQPPTDDTAPRITVSPAADCSQDGCEVDSAS